MTQLDGTLFGESQPCFGCSPKHPFGFKLRFEKKTDEIITRFTPGEHHQGPPGIMHGGLVMTLADELGAWTIIALLNKFGFTGAFEGKLLQPIRIGEEIVGQGRITKDGSRVVSVAVTLSQNDTCCFKGQMRFVILDKQGAEKMLGQELPESWNQFTR